MKKSLFAILGLLVCSSFALAQTSPTISAFDYAYGQGGGPAPFQVAAGAPIAGTYAITLAYGVTNTVKGTQITPFDTCVSSATCPPISIGSGTNFETVTPTSASCLTPAVINTCTVTAVFGFGHAIGDTVRSGDFGLQEAAQVAVSLGGGLVTLTPQWFQAAGGHTAGLTLLTGQKSLATSTYTVLDYSGIAGVFSYAAASGSVYASTTHVLY